MRRKISIRNIVQRLKIKGMSLVEVLVSLAIVSFTILMMLLVASTATQRATYNKMKIQMISAGNGILNDVTATLFRRYRDADWNMLLNGYIYLDKDATGELIANVSAACTDATYPLDASCPSIADIMDLPSLSYIGYVIHAEPQPTQNVYLLTITLGCKTNEPKCNPEKIRASKLQLYVVKY